MDFQNKSTEQRARVACVGLSLALVLALASLLTLFGIVLLDSITDYHLGVSGLLLLAVVFLIQNFGMLALVAWLASRFRE
jgi:predicted tellurium resistance membrane protein TerC